MLSDPQKRQQWDSGMDLEEINGGGGGGGMGRADMNDIFAQMFAGGMGGGGMGGFPGGASFRFG